MSTHYENIPKVLQMYPQWVCVSEGSKVPMRANEPLAASSTDSTTWAKYQDALCSLLYYDYLGFVFNGNGIVGIDIDCGYDEDGNMSEIAQDIIERCKSYTEHSRSGRGFHIILHGNLPFNGQNNRQGVEIYQRARYFIMTGDVYKYSNVVDNQSAINYIVNKYFSEQRERVSLNKRGTKIYKPCWDDCVMEDKRLRLKPSYPSIAEGSRNLSLLSLAGTMYSVGYSKKQIYEELVQVNAQACKPPLRVSEIQSICNSIARYQR